MSLTLTQLLTPLENKILDENKSLQKDFMISSLYSFCYYKELISTLHIMAFMSYIQSMNIVLCHLTLLQKLTIHVYRDHMPHLTSLSNGP